MNVNARIESLKLVPVVVLDDAKDAVPLARALTEGGLPVAEVTFRTAAAEDSIRAISRSLPDMLVGAGTITSVAQAETAIAAGARFLVTPGFSHEVTRYAVERSISIFPGVCTPTEVMMAMRYGLGVVKFFPAGQYGGLGTIRALAGPFPGMRFMPTGGVNAGNVRDYLADRRIIACGGSWMVKSELIAAGNFDGVRRLTREAVSLIEGG